MGCRPTDRRHFLKATAAAAAGCVLPLGAADKPAIIPIIDTHQHLWDLGKFRLDWAKDSPALNKNYLPADYRKATEGLNVVKAVYMEVDVAVEQESAEAEFVTELCKKGERPTVAAVVSGRPAADDFEKYLDPFKNNHYIKGIRQVLHNPGNPAGFCLGEKFVRGIRLLGERGLSFDLCMRSGELHDAAKLIDACPDTRFILDHCGNANVQEADRSAWKKGMEAVAKRKNVVCKVSGIVASAKPDQWSADDLAPIVNHTLDVFGPQRVLFGGDWPVCTLAASYRQWVEALKAIVRKRTAEDQQKLFHDNAERFYGLA